MKQIGMKPWCSTQNTGKSRAVRPLIAKIRSEGTDQNVLITAQGSCLKVCQLDTGEVLYQLNGGHQNSRIVTLTHVKQDSRFAISCAKNGSLVCWNLLTKKPIFGSKLETPAIELYVLNSEELLIVTKKSIFRSRVENLFTRQGLVNFPLVEVAKCDLNDARQVTFLEQNKFLAFISCAKTSKIGILSDVDDVTSLMVHQFGKFKPERMERTRWYARDNLREDMRAFLECVSLCYREMDRQTVLSIGGFSGRVYHYLLDLDVGEIKIAPQIDHYHGYGIHDMMWCDDGLSLITVGREPVIVKTKVTFGELEIGETEGNKAKKRNRTFIPHLHLGMDRIVVDDKISFTAALHQDGAISVFGNDIKCHVASFSNPLAIKTSKKILPVSRKKEDKLNLNRESQFQREKLPFKRFGENLLILPSAKPGVVQFLNPVENKLIHNLDVSVENFIIRDEGSRCSQIKDIATWSDKMIAIIEERQSEIGDEQFQFCRISLYKFEEPARFELVKSIDYNGEFDLNKVEFSPDGQKLAIVAEKQECFVYGVSEETGKWEYFQTIRMGSKCRIRDVGFSHDSSILAVCTKLGLQLIELDGETHDSSPLLKSLTYNAKSVNFFTKRFKRHQIVLELFETTGGEPNLLIIDTLTGSVVEKQTIPETIKNLVYCTQTQKVLAMTEKFGYLLDQNLKVLEQVKPDKYAVVLGCAVILGRVAVLSENGVFIGIDEENESEEVMQRLGGCELVNNKYIVGGGVIYGERPKTSTLFESSDITGKSEFMNKESRAIGDLKNRRAMAVLGESNIHDIPVNYSLRNMKADQFCFELL